MKLDKIFILSNVCLSLLSVSAIGSTFAWYQYTIRANMNYHGASIGNSEQLEIGLISNVDLVDHRAYMLEQDKDNPNLYWAPGTIDSKVLSYYLEENGYATNTLIGVSSGSYNYNEELHLKRAPTYNDNYDDVIEAAKHRYCKLKVAFRVKSVKDQNVYIPNKRISLRRCDVLSEGELAKSMRVYMSTFDEKFIFNPTSYENGFHDVGGILDLNEDGYYDFMLNKETNEYQETYYGQYEDIVYKDTKFTLDDEHLEDKVEGNTFSATHREGVFGIDLDNTSWSKANYFGKKELIDKRKTIVLTDENGFGTVDLSIYLEGWDKSFINNELGSKFNLDMEFEIN